MIGPIIAGAMTEHINWQSFWWLNVAAFCVLIILILVAFPETKFINRDKLVDKQLQDAGLKPETETTGTATPDRTTTSAAGENGEVDDEAAIENTKSLAPMNTQAEVEAMDPWLHKGYPGKHQFPTIYYPRLTRGNFAAALLRDFWIPWKVFAFPIVEFAAFVFSWSASNFLVVNLTQSQVFAAPPYNFGAQSVGFTNFAVYAGSLIAIATAGPFSDWVAMRQTIRNNGIREPEMRLLALVPYTVLLFLGSLIIALGYEYQWPWPVIVVIGYTFIGIQVSNPVLPSIFHEAS